MRVVRAADFTASRPWGSLDLERIADATVRLHWTDQAYIRHVNDGPEVFAVLDGTVDMHVRDGTGEKTIRLQRGDLFHARPGDEHKAEPLGEARVLVIEKAGSV